MKGRTDSNDLSERAQALLKTLVEQYIDQGQPVGSNTLLERSGMSASSATIRNVMSKLEKLGLVRSPHTSAGRIPTDRGYRCFVDTLLKVQPINSGTLVRLQEDFELGARSATSSRDVITNASTVLSSLTHLAGVVTLPHQPHQALNRIEFLPLSGRKVLAILVVNNKEVENRIIELDHELSESELRQASSFLNEQFAGADLSSVREQLVTGLEKTRGDLNESMTDAIAMARSALEDSGEAEDEFVVAGKTHLMDCDDLSDVEKLRALFDMFNEQRDILHLLDKSLSADGVKIFIGEESGYDLLDACSVVTAPYSNDEGVVGVLAVIGPTRMAYEHVIPIVDMTAKLLGSALKSRR